MITFYKKLNQNIILAYDAKSFLGNMMRKLINSPVRLEKTLAKKIIVLIIILLSLVLLDARALQYARPDQDVDVNSWTEEPLWSKVDETVAVDTTGDRINSTLITVSSATNISLSALTDPVSSTGHVIRVRYRKQGLRGTGGGCGGADYLLGIRLFQGTTKIVNATYYNVPCTFVYTNYTLTASEADSITDYSNLTLMLFGNIMGLDIPTRKLQVSWAELEVPDVTVAQKASILSIRNNYKLILRGNYILRLRT